MGTIKLYQQDVYMQDFQGIALEVIHQGDKDLLLLDQSVFFPEGGGQDCDLGTINGFPVEKVTEKEGQILHQISPGSGIKPGDKVRGKLDWPRRFRNMQRHCGEHILSGMFYRAFGGVNRGFHMGSDYMTIDISLEEDPTYTTLTLEMSLEVEFMANQAIWEDLPVITRYFENREEASNLPMRKALALEEDITVVSIGSMTDPADCVACCGTHPTTSGQVGLIKIYKVENYKGMFRVYFEAGADALADYRTKHQLIESLNKRYSAATMDLMEKIGVQEEKNKEMRSRFHKLRQIVIEEKTLETVRQMEEGRTLTTMEFQGLDTEDLLQIGRPLQATIPGLLVLIHRETSTLLFFSDGKKVDCGKLVRETGSIYNGKGGGNSLHARVILPKEENIPIYIDLLEKHLRP